MALSTARGKETRAYLREVPTKIGTFTVHFPYGVISEHDAMNRIPKVISEFTFVEPSDASTKDMRQIIADTNARGLQKALNDALYFGTTCPQGKVELLYGERIVIVR